MTQAILTDIVPAVTVAVELAGVAVILGGSLLSGALCLRQALRGSAQEAIARLRSNVGRSILLGLELLVAADIIFTVAIEPNLDSVAVLAGIVLIRTFLSFSLEVEIEGRWPWQRGSREP